METLENRPYKERLREPGWFSLQKGQFQRDQRNRDDLRCIQDNKR